MTDTDPIEPEHSETSSEKSEAPIPVASSVTEAGAAPETDSVSAIDEPRDAPPMLGSPPPEKTVLPPQSDPLVVLRWVAPIGVLALILGRFIAPAIPGVAVGVGAFVRGVELLGGAFSQMFAVAVIVGLAVTLAHSAVQHVALWMRLFAMALSAFAALVVLNGAATSERIMESAALFAGFLAGAFAVLAALASRGTRVVRLPALALGLVGVSALARSLRGILLLSARPLLSVATLTTLGRVATTLATVLVGLAAIFVIVYVGRNARSEANSPKEGASLWTPATLVVLVLAVICARQAAAGASPDAGFFSVVLKRASDRFLLQPEPYIRGPLRLFLGFLTPLTAVSVLTARRMPSLAAALSLALVAADVTDAPIGAATLMLASLGILLVARSGHVLWSTLVAAPPTAPRGPSAPASY